MAKESHVSTASAPSLTVTILSEVGRILGGPNMKTLANQRGVLYHVTRCRALIGHLASELISLYPVTVTLQV